MSQKGLQILIFLLAVVLISQTAPADAVCNVCSEFGIACVNETSFNLCQGSVPKTDRIYTCPSNKQCSDKAQKCVTPTADVPATCSPTTTSCGICDDNKLFVCTSRTSFVQCDGVTATNVTGSCSDEFVCDSRGGELCKNECTRPEVLECD